MGKALRVLIIVDPEVDAYLVLHTLRSGGYEVTYEIVQTEDAMRAALQRQDWNLITSDQAMPRFNASAGLTLAQQLMPSVPFRGGLR
jgi:CheY-like chemotaxis protein